MKPNERIPDPTLLDYFAAHAPETIPHWFRPVMPSPRPADKWVGDPNSEHPGEVFPNQQAAEKACGFECFSNVSWKAQDEWDADVKVERFIQWPFAWALRMVTERRRLAMSPAAIDPMDPKNEKDAAFLRMFYVLEGIMQAPTAPVSTTVLESAIAKAKTFLKYKAIEGKDYRYTGD